MEPSDIDGRPGDETPGQFLERLLDNAPRIYSVDPAGPYLMGESEDQIIPLDDIAAQFKAAILAGQI